MREFGAARQPITDLPASDPLGIVKNGPGSFKERKLGLLLSDGADAAIFTAAGIADDLDEACLPLGKAGDAGAFVDACRALRFWSRELEVDLDA